MSTRPFEGVEPGNAPDRALTWGAAVYAHRRRRGSAAAPSAGAQPAVRAILGHEIRMPLHIIAAGSEVIAEHLEAIGDHSLDSLIDAIRRSSARLLDTLLDTLDLTQLDAGAFHSHPVPIRLASLVGSVVESFRGAADAKGLALLWRSDHRAANVVFDPACLSRALFKLVDNAIKFTPSGSVRVRLSRDARQAPLITIEDTGIGIDEAFLPRLGEPFVQEDQTNSKASQGAGLGIALAKRLLEVNGARLSVESRRGHGSTFRVHFDRCRRVA